jgi:hypothetical protein
VFSIPILENHSVYEIIRKKYLELDRPHENKAHARLVPDIQFQRINQHRPISHLTAIVQLLNDNLIARKLTVLTDVVLNQIHNRIKKVYA